MYRYKKVSPHQRPRIMPFPKSTGKPFRPHKYGETPLDKLGYFSRAVDSVNHHWTGGSPHHRYTTQTSVGEGKQSEAASLYSDDQVVQVCNIIQKQLSISCN